MAEKIKVVITIPKYYLEHPQDYTCLAECVRRGTVLPEHRRLIDADSLIKAIKEKAKRLSNVDTINGLCGAVALIFDAPTIVESDKGVLEKINEKQDSLRATCKAWDEATEKDGYVN